MRVITIKRRLRNRRSILRFARDFCAGENHLEFVIEVILFAALLTVSAFPIIAAAGAINQIL
jgi:hypothetical protein